MSQKINEWLASQRPVFSKVAYVDEEIRDNRARRYYLRTKYNRDTGTVVLSIRTARRGKGQCLARVQGRSVDDVDVLHGRLAKKFRPFRFVILVPYTFGGSK